MAGADKSPTPNAEADKAAAGKLTAADAAKRVKRTVQVADEDGKVTTKDLAIKASEVLAFRDYGTHVVVVTTDGQKFSTAE